MEIRVLLPGDDRSRFRSGNIELDRFFHRFAGQNQFRIHVGVTHVAVEQGELIGFATVSAAQVNLVQLPEAARKRLPAYPVPVLRLSRMAVSESMQGRGVGRALLRHVLRLAVGLATDSAGCQGVLVDAKPGAQSFYAAFGFVQLAVDEGRLGALHEIVEMYLGMERILAAVPRAH